MPYIVKYFEILVNSGLFLTPHKTAFGFHQSPIIFQKHLSNIETTKGRGKSHFHFHTKNTNQHEICYVDDLLFYDSENDILFCDSEVYSESGSSRKEYQQSICLETVLYDGLFRQGKAHGGGKIKYPNGETYVSINKGEASASKSFEETNTATLDNEFPKGKSAEDDEEAASIADATEAEKAPEKTIPLVFRKLLSFSQLEYLFVWRCLPTAVPWQQMVLMTWKRLNIARYRK